MVASCCVSRREFPAVERFVDPSDIALRTRGRLAERYVVSRNEKPPRGRYGATIRLGRRSSPAIAIPGWLCAHYSHSRYASVKAPVPAAAQNKREFSSVVSERNAFGWKLFA
jgi:hypothetical protein